MLPGQEHFSLRKPFRFRSAEAWHTPSVFAVWSDALRSASRWVTPGEAEAEALMAADTQNFLPLPETVPLQEIVDLTQKLVSFPSTLGNHEALRGCLHYMKEWCADAGLRVQLRDTRTERSLYLGPTTHKAPLLLLSHFDVAAAPEHMFSAFVCDDQLYGRGVLDDKYAVALSLILYREAFRARQHQGGDQNDVPLMIAIVGDGEEGGLSSTQPLLDDLDPDFGISLDGGDPRHIITREKGVLRLELEAYGEASDGARPWRGQNAMDALIADYLVLSSLMQRKRREGDTSYWYPTMNLDMASAGAMINQVPDSGLARLDIRFTEHEDPKILYDELRHAVTGSLGVMYEEPVFESLPSPWRDTLFQLTGAREGKSHGGSGAHCFARRNVSGVVWGAEGDGSQHSSSEHLHIPSIVPIYQGLIRLVNAVSQQMEEGRV